MEQQAPGNSWKDAIGAFFARFGEVMGNVVLGALYYLLLGPVAIFSRLLSDPLRRRRPADSAFLPWSEENESLTKARRQG